MKAAEIRELSSAELAQKLSDLRSRALQAHCRVLSQIEI